MKNSPQSISRKEFFMIVYKNYQNMDTRILGHLIHELNALYEMRQGNQDMTHYLEDIEGQYIVLPKVVKYVKK